MIVFFPMNKPPQRKNILAFFEDNTVLSGILGALSIAFLIIAEVLRTQINKAKFYGASMQQYFDEIVFGLKNSCKKYIVPQKLTQSEKLKLTLKYKNKNSDAFKNWYSDFSSLPYEQAVYQCQKQNIRWDLFIKKRYLSLLIVCASLMAILVILNAIIRRNEVASLMVILSSCLPLFSYFLTSFIKLNRSINAQENLYKHIERIEKQIKEENNIWNEVEELQIEIFAYRKKAYLIPDWFHRIFKKQLHESETEMAKLVCKEEQSPHEEAED